MSDWEMHRAQAAKPQTLWDEFDAMAFNLKQQAHAVGELEGRALLDVAARIESVLKRYPRSAEGQAPEMAVAGEIRPGRGYLLSTDSNITPETAEIINDKLAERFPDSTFAILSPSLKLAGGDNLVTQDALQAALKQAEARVIRENENATGQGAKIATYGAARALRVLWQALLSPERDGSDAPSPVPPAPDVAPDPSRPTGYLQATYPTSCGAVHPWMDSAWCTLNPHPDKRHEAVSADAYRTVVGWTEP